MKKMTRAFSIAVAAIMTLCLCTFNLTVSATAGVNEIVITNSNSAVSISGNTYTAYKVFAASVSGAEDTAAYTYTLDENCLNGATGYAALNASYTPAGLASANAATIRAFADALYNEYINGKTVPATVHQATGVVPADSQAITLTVANPGYYIVVGTATSVDGEGTTVTSLAMLDTASDQRGVDISLKADAPTITSDGKKAKDSDGSTSAQIIDSEIGEIITYTIDVTVPHINGYSSYTYNIKDELSNGLEYVTDSVSLKKNSTAIASTYWTPTINNTNHTMTVAVDILSALSAATPPFSEGDTLTLTYQAKVVGTDAKYAIKDSDDANFNSNTVKLEYSNNPYNTSSTDETPTFKSYDYTYGVEFDKIKSGTTTGLAGAVFNIYKGATSGTALSFKKVSAENAEVPVYKLAVSGETGTVTDLTGGTTGKFIAYGFDADVVYNLKEKTAPSGYAKIDNDIPFNITATLASTGGDSANMITSLVFNNSNKNTSDNIVYSNGSAASGLTIQIPNTSGSKLVGTGGIGTTIFYVLGGILMAGAVILLVTKLRMKNK